MPPRSSRRWSSSPSARSAASRARSRAIRSPTPIRKQSCAASSRSPPGCGARVKKFVLLLLFLVAPVQAQNYPQRPIRMIVPFAAGGTTDALGRVLAFFMSERLGQQVVVENRPGGGGTPGPEGAARSQPDGYTLLLGSAEAFGMTEGMRQRLAYNPERDLVPVAMVARSPNIFIVHPSVPVKSVPELVEYAKKHNLRYGS